MVRQLNHGVSGGSFIKDEKKMDHSETSPNRVGPWGGGGAYGGPLLGGCYAETIEFELG